MDHLEHPGFSGFGPDRFRVLLERKGAFRCQITIFVGRIDLDNDQIMRVDIAVGEAPGDRPLLPVIGGIPGKYTMQHAGQRIVRSMMNLSRYQMLGMPRPRCISLASSAAPLAA